MNNNEKTLVVSPTVKSTFPQARFGVLAVSGLGGENDRTAMERIVASELEQIRARYPDYDRKAVLETEPLCHYAAYYRRFKKTYHVLGQLESVVLKGKGIPPVGAPVEAMFTAEVKNLLLTAGHDLDLIEGNMTVDIAIQPVPYVGMSGKEQAVAQDDLFLSDEKGVLSSILNGPDRRTRITENTNRALYFVYGVEGVTQQRIEAHLETIASYLTRAVPGVEVQPVEIY